MQAIVVTFDRLATGLLGCYGNGWMETPHLDRLASTSTVFDNHFVDTTGPSAGVAWATGHHALRRGSDRETSPLGRALRAAGVVSRAIVDEGATSSWWKCAEFDAVQTVRGIEGLDVAPEAVSIARLVQAGLASWSDDSFEAEHRLLWLHAPEPGLPPEGFTTLYFEDFEERGTKMSELPREDWPRHPAVMGGSMSLVDHWLGKLLSGLNALRERDARPTLLIVAGARGKRCLDEAWTTPDNALFHSGTSPLSDQEVRAPLLIAVFDDERFADLSGLRCDRLVQPIDLAPTLLDWFAAPQEMVSELGRSLLREATSEKAPREYICFGNEAGSFGIRTTEWSCLTHTADQDAEAVDDSLCSERSRFSNVQLFAKSEDIWDVNDIAFQQPEICERLLEGLNDFRGSSSSLRRM